MAEQSRGWLDRAGDGWAEQSRTTSPACLEQLKQVVKGTFTGAETGKDE